MIDTLRLTAEEAIGMLERREVSGAELHAAYREAIDARDEELHCFLTLVDEPEGEGVPIALKDIISTKGVRTTAGSKILEDYVPVFDSTVAERCKAAGLPLLGKTNLDEFAMGSSTENSAFGPTRNPWDPERVPGGSGGGSAAAVAAGLAPWALGSDTGGSIKQPAALSGNVGLRPTYGTVSRYGIVAFASSLDQVGPVTRNVRDNALLYGIISGRDALDSTTVDVPPVELPEAEKLAGLRVGVPRELNEAEGIEPGVAAAVRRAIDLCAELGAEVAECSLPRSVEYGLHGQAQKVRTVIRREFDAAFERFDVLVSPTSPTVAFRLGERTENPLAMYLADVLTIPPNMAGLPGLSIPCGLSEGLPVGLQLIGPQFSENTLFGAGHALERALGFDPVPPRLVA